MTEIRYTGTYQIRTYEIDRRKKVTIPALMQLMQEASMQNVIDLKLSVWDMEPLNLAWVARRMWLQIDDLPSLGDTITIETYPANSEGLFTFRDYLLNNRKGRRLAQCSSKWLLFDTQIRKLRPIPDDLFYFEMPDPGDCLPRPSGKIHTVSSPEIERTCVLEWHDLDFNGHLNNVAYVRLMLEATPPEFLNNHQLLEIDIVFRKEAHWPGKMLSLTEKIDRSTLRHSLRSDDPNKVEFATAITRWTEGF